MIKHAYYIESNNYDPHVNLALEEALFDSLEKDSIVFYLWQNAHTVVIGKNQNAHKECDLEKMKDNNCTLARRSTGGGAVYHDKGNLNFTFISSSDDHSVVKQSQVIIDALNEFGISAELSGRNDIEIDGKKVSGNAYLTKDNKKLHHGTIMLDVNVEEMGKYLRPSKLKLKTRGVDSVRSRVCNVKEFCDISIDRMKEELKKSFEKVYGLKLNDFGIINSDDYINRYKSNEFIYGELKDYTDYFEGRYAFGEVNVYYTKSNIGEIEGIVVYTDSMDDEVVDYLHDHYKDNYDIEELLIDYEKEYLRKKENEHNV